MPHRFEIAAFPLSGPAVYQMIVTLYSVLIVYAFGSVATGVPSISLVAGNLYGQLWPLGLLIATTGALAGVIRSRLTGNPSVEFWATLAIFAALAGYFVAIVWRFWQYGDVHVLPSSLLPVGLGVLPFYRLRAILRRPHGGPPATPRLDAVDESAIPTEDDGVADPETITMHTFEPRVHRAVTGEIPIVRLREGAHDGA